MKDIRCYLKDNKLITDGAFGTYYAGLYDTRELPEKSNIDNKDRVIRVHKEYIDAGAKLIRTNTFASNTINLDTDIDGVRSNIRAAVANAKEAVAQSGREVYIAADIGPIPNDNMFDKQVVEDEYVRAVKGGTGFTKCGGNYASSIAGQVKAEKMGCTQVLWLDGVHRKYVEEVGTMNIMFKIAGEIYTAPLEGTVLPGVTRDSLIHILRDWGYKVNETRLSVDDLMKAGHDGTLEEVFGTGTAAVISPVGELRYKDDVVTVNNFEIGELTQKLYDTLTGIQWGRIPDKYGWTVEVK